MNILVDLEIAWDVKYMKGPFLSWGICKYSVYSIDFHLSHDFDRFDDVYQPYTLVEK